MTNSEIETRKHDAQLEGQLARPASLKARAESGKVGLAILMWMLGVPGGLVLLYLVFG